MNSDHAAAPPDQAAHRIANVLQIVASLVSVHARRDDEVRVQQMQAAIQAQIETLGLVCRCQDRAGPGMPVDLAGLAGELAAALERQLQALSGQVADLGIAVGTPAIAADAAMPMAMLITELVLLAGRQSAPGRVRIDMRSGAEPGQLVIVVMAPVFAGPDALAAVPSSPAARLVAAMATQLGGTIHHDAAGHRYHLIVPAALP